MGGEWLLTEGLRLSLEGVWAHRLRSSLAVLGIIIGVAAMIASYSITAGARRVVLTEFGASAATVFSVTSGEPDRGEPGTQIPITEEDVRAIEARLTGIRHLVRIQGLRLPWHHDKSGGSWFIAGVNASMGELGVYKVPIGRFFTEAEEFQGANVLVLGKALADEVFGKSDPVGQTIRLGDKPFLVVGVVQRGSDIQAQLDPGSNDDVFIPVTTAQRMIGGKEYGQLFMQTLSPSIREVTRTQVTRVLRQRHPGVHYRTGVMDEDLQQLDRITRVLSGVVVATTSVALFVGSIGIANIMLIAVRERTKEIGISKAIGATPPVILIQFLMESSVLAILGGLGGIIVGYSGAQVITKLWLRVPLEIDVGAIGLGLLVSLITGIIAGAYPAYQAAKLEPVEALRYE